MRIFIVCSKHFYGQVKDIQDQLEKLGHSITLPNSFDNPGREQEMKDLSAADHAKWKASMLREQAGKIAQNEAILVLNFEKNNQPNYIGGATFTEMFKAWELGKNIFLYNPVPESILTDEILGFEPTVIKGDLLSIK